MISFDRRTCNDLAACAVREWIESNGIGGYGSSSICGLNTRRYHGLLVAATNPPVGRMVLLSKIEETFILDGQQYDLSTNRYPGTVHPNGYMFLKEFRLDPYPIFTFEVEGVEIEKRVFLVNGENTTVVGYHFRGLPSEKTCEFELRPLIAFRDYHATAQRNDALNHSIEAENGLVAVKPYEGVPTLYFAHNAENVEPQGFWYFNFEYEAEQKRGFYDREDLFNPFVARYSLRPGMSIPLIVSTVKHSVAEAAEMHDREMRRRAGVDASSPHSDPLIRSLSAAADQFLVKRGELDTIIAGYHWFADWGRDTMIALPGLTMTTGRYGTARSILRMFARSVNQGMLPNRFLDNGEAAEYNTVDAALWMFEAVREYLVHTDDWNFVKDELYDALGQIIDWYRSGTRFGIKMDEDGLIRAGEEGVQLTWMDAIVGGTVITPRHGKAVEIQALWYHALRTMEYVSAQFEDNKRHADCANLADRVRTSFNKVFWNEGEGYLYDVVDGDERDASMRPNQIFAVSLFHSMLESKRARSVVATVERELLTPLGLRTLAATDPRYRGRYEGDAASRDSAYHQGTVWPWLAGPFFMALLKVNGSDSSSRRKVTAWLKKFQEHLLDAGLGQVSEIFDGDPPHQAAGCIAQAWSVAEILRLAVALSEFDRPIPEPPVKTVRPRRESGKKASAAAR